MIERIRIRGYRSLHDVDVKLEPLTVLIGRSGTGKSNFVRALRLLRDCLLGKATVAGNEPFGDLQLTLGYEVTLNIKSLSRLIYELEFDGDGSVKSESLRSDSRGVLFRRCLGDSGLPTWDTAPPVVPLPQLNGIILGRLTGVREAMVAFVALTSGIRCYDFTGSVLQDEAVFDENSGYYSAAATSLDAAAGYPGAGDTSLAVAGRIVDNIEQLADWRDVGKALAALNRHIESVDLVMPDRKQLRVGYKFGDKVQMVDVAEESEGFRRFLAHLLALYQTPRKQTLVFEHPESGIHPGALEALAEEFRLHVGDGRGQVILTTHSPQFLDYFEPEQIRVVENEDGVTRIGPPAEEQLDLVREAMIRPGFLLTADPARIAEPTEAVAAGS